MAGKQANLFPFIFFFICGRHNLRLLMVVAMVVMVIIGEPQQAVILANNAIRKNVEVFSCCGE